MLEFFLFRGFVRLKISAEEISLRKQDHQSKGKLMLLKNVKPGISLGWQLKPETGTWKTM